MFQKPDPLECMMEACRRLGEVDEGNTHELAASLWEVSISYFKDVRAQAQRSFYSALFAAAIGVAFFFTALGLMMFEKLPFSKLTLTAGMSIQVISAIGFYLYARTSRQFATFHVCLERANRFLLANSICEELDPAHRDEIRKKLIILVAEAPLLSLDLVEHGDLREIQGSESGAT
jgi:hypothetical protein